MIAILLEIAAANARALKVPEPFAILSNFGADALETLVFFPAQQRRDAGAGSEVRLEILKRFREERSRSRSHNATFTCAISTGSRL